MDAVNEVVRVSNRSRCDANWEAVEHEYRTGQLSVREIGRIHGISHTAITKRARKEGWTQNLAAKVHEEVAARLVSSEVATSQAVEEAATRVISLVREHRRDIGSARQLVATLVSELQDASENIGEIEDAIEMEADGNRRRMMLKAVSLPTRSSVIANLSVAMKNLVGLERQAFNLDVDMPTVKTTWTLPPEEFAVIARELIASV